MKKERRRMYRMLSAVLTICMVMSLLVVPMEVKAGEFGTQSLEINGAGQTFAVSADGQTLTYAGGTVQVYVNGTLIAFTIDAEATSVEKTSAVQCDLTTNGGTGDTVEVRVKPGEGYTPSVRMDGSDQSLSSNVEGNYQYVQFDFSKYRSISVNFTGGGTAPAPEEPTDAPDDAISIELWDNFEELVNYSTYSSTEDVILGDGAVIEAIGAIIQYSYDKNSWNELSNVASDANLSYEGNRYVFATTIPTVYIKVVSVKNGYLKSKALNPVDDGYKVDAGAVTNGRVYEITKKGACDFHYDNGKKTIVWSYDPAEFGADGAVTNGTVKVLSAKDANGKDVLNQTGVFYQTDKGGHVEIPAGALVTVQIIPNYGYQFVSGSLNGNVVTPSSEVSTFTFTMPKTNLHLSALFKESKDQIAITANGVTSGAITGGANVIDSGNLKLTVANSGMSDTQKAAMQASSAAANVNVTNWLEVDLQQIVNKGNETDVWTTDLEELKQKITITLNVGTGLDTTKEYVVVREHEGVYEQIPAVYDAAAGTLTFQSDKFSNYAVGTVETTPVLSVGEKFTDLKTNSSFEVTKSDAQSGTVAYTGTTNKKAKTITIPDTVTVDGITYKVTSIADKAFQGNKKLTKVTISKNVTTIGKNVFKGCTKLKKIVIKSKKLTKKTVAKNAFKGVSKKATIKVPKGKAKAYRKLFRKKGLSKKVKVK